MGYETTLIIGTATAADKDGKRYFLHEAMVELYKCGYEGALPDLISKVTGKDRTENCKEYPLVYWSRSYKIKQEEILKSIFDEYSFIKDGKYEHIKTLLGEKRDVVKENIEELAELFEGWEHNIVEDCYGSALRAVPLKEVYDAMLKSNAESILEDGSSYRRYDIALGVLKSFMEIFPYREVREDEYDHNKYCVLWGH